MYIHKRKKRNPNEGVLIKQQQTLLNSSTSDLNLIRSPLPHLTSAGTSATTPNPGTTTFAAAAAFFSPLLRTRQPPAPLQCFSLRSPAMSTPLPRHLTALSTAAATAPSPPDISPPAITSLVLAMPFFRLDAVTQFYSVSAILLSKNLPGEIAQDIKRSYWFLLLFFVCGLEQSNKVCGRSLKLVVMVAANA